MPPFFRVPLIYPTALVLYRLDPETSYTVTPTGAPSAGFDPDFKEPYPYDDSGVKVDTRRYLDPIRLPCQAEAHKEWEQERQFQQGDAPLTSMVFTVHRANLATLGLLGSNQTPLIKVDDKITALEKNQSPGVVVLAFQEPLYIVEVRPGSFGMGATGYDLHMLFAETRPGLPST